MADCIYCNKPAGFLRKKHKECQKIFDDGILNINLLIDSFIKNDQPVDIFANRITTISENSFISSEKCLEIIFNKWKEIINHYSSILTTSDNVLEKIESINSHYNFSKINDPILEKFNNIIIQRLSRNYSKMVYNTDMQEINTLLKKDVVRYNRNGNSTFIKKIVLNTFENAIYTALDDGVITEQEENSILNFKEVFNLTNDELSDNDAYKKLVKSLVLRDILNGVLPKRMNVTNQLPFILQKNETLIWLINDVEYYVDKERKHYTGGSQGMSLRIAKGVYYRVGAFKGQPVITTEKVFMGRGILGFTNKHLYFFNYRTSFRIKYDKIVSVTPKSDGVIILKDGVTAKQQTFIDGDGWFSYNLIMNLSQIDL